MQPASQSVGRFLWNIFEGSGLLWERVRWCMRPEPPASGDNIPGAGDSKLTSRCDDKCSEEDTLGGAEAGGGGGSGRPL